LHGRVFRHGRALDALGIAVERPLAWWSAWDRSEYPAAGRRLAAAARAIRGAGRILWFGAMPQAIAASEDAYARAWFEGLGAWLAGTQAGVDFAAWPDDAHATLLLEQDSEDRFEHADAFRAALDRRSLRGTFLCVSNLAARHPALVRRIALRHEIGSHTDDHRILEGAPFEEQRRRLAHSRHVLEDLIGRRASSFRAPEERMDTNTWAALQASGFTTVVAGNGERAMPEVRGDALVSIPRIVTDDYDWLVRAPIPADSIAPTLQRALERACALRGILVVSVHTQLAGAPALLPALDPFLDELSTRPIWITTATEAADWWRARAACTVSIATRAGRFVLLVENHGAGALAGLVAQVELPFWMPGIDVDMRVVAHAAAAGAGAQRPERDPTLLIPNRDGTFSIPLPRLEAGERRSFVLAPHGHADIAPMQPRLRPGG
jgi:peptidoglycan/xylan/chitin deacetylase (PgdA/CDA1 family)